MNELLVLLLPLAAFTGWWLARSHKKSENNQKEDDYFKGLSYLLEDETDKAIEIFFRIAHLDDSTIENQITLGNLFRHRGEIDRALHIHSSLSSKSELGEDTRQKLNLALAEDYYAAGIMNHAEEFFQKVRLCPYPDMRETARHRLVTLYAEQSYWQKAIDVVAEIDPFGRLPIQQQAAHFYCELAALLLQQEPPQNNQAIELLQSALACDKKCVRATISLGELAKGRGDYIEAIGYFRQIEHQNPQFLIEILNTLEDCYFQLQQRHEWKNELSRLVTKFPNPALILRLNQLIAETEGRESAMQFLQHYLEKTPNVLMVQSYLKLLNAQNDGTHSAKNTEKVSDTSQEAEQCQQEKAALVLLNHSVDKMLGVALKYRCRECGFRGNKLNWQCPGCKNWGTFTPVSSVSLKENID